jgi:LAGLIDADG DNA endonuclease family/Cytochrome c oxidase subunit III
MTNLTRSNFQAHPFHLVSPSPWPLFTCIALFTLTTAGVLTMHGFSNAGYFLTLGFLSLIGSMAFWFRDVISEGRAQSLFSCVVLFNYTLNIVKAISQEEIKQILINFSKENANLHEAYLKDNELGYCLAGLLENFKKRLILISLILIFILFSVYCVNGFCLIEYCSLVLPPATTLKKTSIKHKSESKTTDLVVWVKNLWSGISTRKLTSQELKMFKLPLYQKSVIVGLLLSDGWLTYASANNKNARLGFEQSYSRSDYVWFVFHALSHYCSSFPVLKISGCFAGGNPKFSSLKFTTRSLPCFSDLHNLFYSNKTKIIPHNIYDLLTPVALAHTTMGDGTIASNGLRICTDSFSAPEVVILMNVLMIKYRLDCTLFMDRGRPRIYISAKSIKLLESIVKPYTIPSMYYKIIR